MRVPETLRNVSLCSGVHLGGVLVRSGGVPAHLERSGGVCSSGVLVGVALVPCLANVW